MAIASEKLTKTVLALPARTRARLAEKLLASLDDPGQPEIDALWADEVEDRITAFERGKIRAVPGEQAFRGLKRRSR